MSESDILAAFADLPAIGSLWRHHKGSLVVVTGHAWDAERDAALVCYRHADCVWWENVRVGGGRRTPPPADDVLSYDMHAVYGEVTFTHTLADWSRVVDGTPRFRREA